MAAIVVVEVAVALGPVRPQRPRLVPVVPGRPLVLAPGCPPFYPAGQPGPEDRLGPWTSFLVVAPVALCPE